MCSSVYIVPPCPVLGPDHSSKTRPVLPLVARVLLPLPPCRQYMQNLYQIVSVYALFVAISLIFIDLEIRVFGVTQLHASSAT